MAVIYVTDLEAARDRVTASGGRIIHDIYGFPGGRRFHFADPAGNELAVWSDAGSPSSRDSTRRLRRSARPAAGGSARRTPRCRRSRARR